MTQYKIIDGKKYPINSTIERVISSRSNRAAILHDAEDYNYYSIRVRADMYREWIKTQNIQPIA